MRSKSRVAAALRRPARGYALPFVIVMLIILAVAMGSMLFVLGAGARSTDAMLGRRKAFYVCDGIGRLAVVSAARYLGTVDSTPSDASLRTAVCADGGGCTTTSILPTFVSQTPGFQVTDFTIHSLGSRVIEPLSSGPFEGMIAAQDGIELSITAKKTSTGWSCSQSSTMTLGKIGMFEFFLFSDQAYTDWAPGPEMAAIGRVHVNGGLCLGSDNGPLWIDRATATGSIFHSASGSCRAGSDGDTADAVKIAFVDAPTFDTDTTNADPVQPEPLHFREFTSGFRTASWASDALSTFNSHLLDAAHNVQTLKLPVIGTASVQNGYDASGSTSPGISNPPTRILVDPVATGDSIDIKRQKFAFKSDIRIINGVWYLRDVSNPEAWPGTPIWSDHPGNYTIPSGGVDGVGPSSVAVGQEDLAASTARNWGATRPKRYSYYRFDSSGNMKVGSGDPSAIISYGVLARDSGTGSAMWKPGLHCNGGASSASVVDATNTSASCAIMTAGAGVDSVGGRLLRGARSGFRDGFIYKYEHDRSGDEDAANILPINLDVAALQNALATTTNGELGSYFASRTENGQAAPFNGIIWITSTWSGSSSAPNASLPPSQTGSFTSDTDAAGSGTPASLSKIEGLSSHALDNSALPYPLCSGTALADDASAAGRVADASVTPSVDTGFDIEGCDRFTSATGNLRNARPIALRVFNARNVNRSVDARPAITVGQLPRGLTIATNLPVYLLGDINLSSDPTDLSATSPWVPVLIAGDNAHILSNAWNDVDARWSKAITGAGANATATTVRVELLAGWLPTTTTINQSSGGVHNFPRFHEDWSGIPLQIRGSLVIGWASVYTRAPWNTIVYDAPQRDWGFDRHLEQITKQPPGAPFFDVAATRQWSR